MYIGGCVGADKGLGADRVFSSLLPTGAVWTGTVLVGAVWGCLVPFILCFAFRSCHFVSGIILLLRVTGLLHEHCDTVGKVKLFSLCAVIYGTCVCCLCVCTGTHTQTAHIRSYYST